MLGNLVHARDQRDSVGENPEAARDQIAGRHFDDDLLAYGFHDSAPRYQVENGGTYGIPYRALPVRALNNLLVAGMMITADHRAHLSTRNTVSCMGQDQAGVLRTTSLLNPCVG